LKVLVTRPEPGAAVAAAQLRRLGFEPVLFPCLTVEPIAARLPEQPGAILLTSGQAIPMLPAKFRSVPCFCVGDATAARLRESGFDAVESARGDADDLFALVTARRLAGTHLLAVGERHGLDLAARLRASGIRVIRRKLYRTRPVRVVPAAVRRALLAGEIGGALFYSAETARAFIGLQPPGTAQITALALSPAVAAACQGLPWRKIHVALAPDEAHLLALLR
jgi:uroporphyrinogen-III synthase